MEVLRCRFLDYKPGEIMHLAANGPDCLCLFEDSSIHLYKLPTWSLTLSYPSTLAVEFRRVIWLSPDSFAVSGLGGLLQIFPTTSLEASFSSQISGNGIWDMSRNENILALACDDGILRLFTLEDEEYYISASFPRQDSKLLSVISSEHFYFVGTSTGSIVKFTDKGQVVQRMQTGSPVWCLGFAHDFLVSGESAGVLSFWQHARGTLKQGLKTHEGDILTLCVLDGEVFASGVDPKVVRCDFVGHDWVVTGKAKGQSHDIRSLVFADGNLLSGGVTSDICVYTSEVFHTAGTHPVNSKGKVGAFNKTPMRHIATLPFVPIAKARCNLLLECKGHALDLWTVDSTLRSVTKLLTVNCKGNSGIAAFDIHKDGSILAFATILATRLVRVSAEEMKAEFIEEKFKPCSVMVFSDDMLHCAFHEYFVINLKNFEVSVSFRFDSVATRISNEGNFTSILLKNNKVLVFKNSKLFFQLPLITRTITALALAHNIVLIATDDNNFQGFSCKTQQLENFTAKYFSCIPKNFTNDVNRIIGILPFGKLKLVVYTHYSFTVVDLAKKPPKRSEILAKEKFPEHKHTWAGILSLHSLHSRSLKQDGEVCKDLENFAINKRFGPILSFGFDNGTGWVCELDWERALESKTKPLVVHKYGT